ncbi:MAG: 16S rRNA (guanine(966)-N(2))-methyltransferase RsmD [Planctomycetaceae bacterium]|nr:16S rRNA (guanine(966)-N(2))-methyltransferase RsmD [Planctomycetaceae bacterium]
MQIVSGKYRHRRLETSPGEITRPITQRVKVALFDRLEPYFVDARVADIFSGTGTIGLEALSRGARSVVFIENDKVALDLLRRNVAALRAEGEVLCWPADASKCSFRPHGGEAFLPFDVVFFDPPYLYVSRMKAGTMLYRSLERLARDAITAPDALLVLRCARHTELEMPAIWQLEQLLEYSSMEVHLFRKQAP